MTTKHSPGPWRVGRKVGRTIYDANDRLIGVMDHIEDARLVAAATELLTLVRLWMGSGCDCHEASCSECYAQGIVARIEGRP